MAFTNYRSNINSDISYASRLYHYAISNNIELYDIFE